VPVSLCACVVNPVFPAQSRFACRKLRLTQHVLCPELTDLRGYVTERMFRFSSLWVNLASLQFSGFQ
jgi:hypothetical protein